VIYPLLDLGIIIPFPDDMLPKIREEIVGKIRWHSRLESPVHRWNDVVDAINSAPHFFEAPASYKYHNSFTGGLAIHSLDVAEQACTMAVLLEPGWFQGASVEDARRAYDSVWIAGFFHDWDKLGVLRDGEWVPRYRRSEERPTGWEYNLEYNKLEVSLSEELLELVQRHVKLTPAEKLALKYSDGQYVERNLEVQHREHALLQIVHWADNWVGMFREATGTGEYPSWKHRPPYEDSLPEIEGLI